MQEGPVVSDVATALLCFDEAVQFHGHACPGLAIGCRIAVEAMRLLEVDRPRDEELVAIVENDTCAVDAIQVITGCTFGKGNLIFKDYGKIGFTFFSRNKKEGLRIFCREIPTLPESDGSRMEELNKKIRVEGSATAEERKELKSFRLNLIRTILTCDADGFLEWQTVEDDPPNRARIHPSAKCDRCGERVMETRIQAVGKDNLCIPCADLTD